MSCFTCCKQFIVEFEKFCHVHSRSQRRYGCQQEEKIVHFCVSTNFNYAVTVEPVILEKKQGKTKSELPSLTRSFNEISSTVTSSADRAALEKEIEDFFFMVTTLPTVYLEYNLRKVTTWYIFIIQNCFKLICLLS